MESNTSHENNTPHCPLCGSNEFYAKQPYKDHDGMWQCLVCKHEDKDPDYSDKALDIMNNLVFLAFQHEK